MATENFPYYGQVNDSAAITSVTANQINYSSVDRDFEVSRYRGVTLTAATDYTFDFEINVTAWSAGQAVFELSDVQGSLNDTWAGSSLYVDIEGDSIRLVLFESGGFIASDSMASPPSIPFTVYPRLTVDADGGGAGKGRFSLLVYTDSGRTSLSDTLTVDASAETLDGYATYMYAFNALDTTGVGTSSGYVKDLEVTPAITALSTSSRRLPHIYNV